MTTIRDTIRDENSHDQTILRALAKCMEDGHDGIYCRDATIEVLDGERDRLKAENERLREAIAFAYGHLWHVNNEPAAPIPLRSPEKAAYEARKVLRDLLTTPERGNGIERARAALAKETKE